MASTRRRPAASPDYLLVLGTLLLLAIGVVMVSSASVVLSYSAFGSGSHLLLHQLLGAGVGLVLFWGVSRVDYHRLRALAPWLMVATILLLAAVVFSPLGTSHGTVAKRWISLGGASFQPAEVIKLCLVIYVAAWLDKRGAEVREFWGGFVPFAILLSLVGGLIMLQPDMGTMMVVTLTAVAMFFASGARGRHLTAGALVAVGVLAVAIKAAPYRLQRITTFLHPQADQAGAGYHVSQALLAIGSGGLFGLGFGHSRQKYNYLPEAATDSIFAIIAEELGLIRAGLLLLLLLFVIWRGFKVALGAPDRFGRLLGVGITAWIGSQALVNIGAMLGVLPLTGVPLPFISYGSSALIVSLLGMGVLVNISRSKESYDASHRQRRGYRRPRLAGVGYRPRAS